MMRLFGGSKTLPWMAWSWTGFALSSWMIDLARPTEEHAFSAAILTAGALLAWNNVRRGR
jgi:hypothetical protein